jgi:hypothetical protein
MKTYFPDTNFFFECRKAVDLPWHDLNRPVSGARPDILLIIPPTVITEIERHKAKGNSRTAKRARDISARLREAILAPNQQTVLRAADPMVVLQLPPVFKIDFSRYPDLDRERPDHRIAAECATMNLPEADVLTDDTLLALAARSIALSTVLIPVEWRLAPENDERDDALARAQSELKTYKQATPEIALGILDANGHVITELNCEIFRYAPTKTDMDAAVSLVERLNPMKTDFREQLPTDVSLIRLMRGVRPIKPEEIGRYQREDYPLWIKQVREKLSKLVSIYNRTAREFSFTVSLENSGFVNAENLTLHLDGFDGVLLLDALDEDDLRDRKKLLSLPGAPKPPTGFDPVWAGMGGLRLSDLDRQLITPFIKPKPRQSDKLYLSSPWPGQTPVDHMELVCKALPHQQDAVKRSFRAYIGEQLGAAPRLRVRVGASNLRKPIEAFIKVKTAETAGDFLSNLSAAGTL